MDVGQLNVGGADSSAVLTVQAVSISISGRDIVRSVNFRLPLQASMAIIGANGSGKTLLLKALLGLLPYSGTVRWKSGIHLGYVPQTVFADPHLPLRGRELLLAKARVQHFGQREIDTAVEIVGIAELLDRPLGTLSSGQLQKVLIGFAMLGTPEVLLIDEPTSSLDELAEQRIFELLGNIRREQRTTVITVSHDLTLLRGAATHVLCLSAGNAYFGTAAQMLVPEILHKVYGNPVDFHPHAMEKQP
ncbi:MAG TPA: ATP-binding cassette domain-containing protein [Terriglobales bacterium]